MTHVVRNGTDPMFIMPSLVRSQTHTQPQTYQETVYITMPPTPPANAPRPNFQTPMPPQERRQITFDAGCKTIVCLGLMFIILVVILTSHGI